MFEQLPSSDEAKLRLMADWMDKDDIPQAALFLRNLADQIEARASNAGEAVAKIKRRYGYSEFDVEWLHAPGPDGTLLYTRAALASARTPEGWKLVPEVMTSEMRTAAIHKDSMTIEEDGQPASIEALWFAALAAAPNAPESKEPK